MMARQEQVNDGPVGNGQVKRRFPFSVCKVWVKPCRLDFAMDDRGRLCQLQGARGGCRGATRGSFASTVHADEANGREEEGPPDTCQSRFEEKSKDGSRVGSGRVRSPPVLIFIMYF